MPTKGPAMVNDFVPGYYETVADILVVAKISNVVMESNWKGLTNKLIYRSYSGHFPMVKVKQDVGVKLDHSWRKPHHPCSSSWTQEILYLNIHNKLPTRERLFRIYMLNDPNNDYCMDTQGTAVYSRQNSLNFHFTEIFLIAVFKQYLN